MEEQLTRIVRFEPAYDKRNPDPQKNCGIHGVTLRMVLKGKAGAVQFVLSTNWQLPHVEKEFDSRPPDKRFPHLFCRPHPSDLGYHSKVPQYEGQEPMGSIKYGFPKGEIEMPGDVPIPKIDRKETGTFTPCEFTDGGPCYYDGSTLNAESVYRALLEGGDEAVWKILEDEYKSQFNKENQNQ